MTLTEHSAFAERSSVKARDEVHRKKLLKVISTYDTAVIDQKHAQWSDWNAARHAAAQVKDRVLADLPRLLRLFEQRISACGVQVLWASDTKEAQAHVMQIVNRHSAKRVVKSKSMTTEEIHLNDLLEGHGMEVLESDLGELIVQLAGETPYHIVTPCMHKSKEEIAELFHEKLGAEKKIDPQYLAGVAREHLRQAYLRADIGVSGANFLIAEEGAIAITENEGNARLSCACPPVHIAFAGIEKVLPNLESLELFLPLLATSGTGQQITAYNSILRGPRAPGETDGPLHMYVILIDNGRSALYADPKFRESLRCIRCGACLNACPVYKTVGGHSYNTTYPGPIGAVISPHLRGIKRWNHLAYASSLCGACTEVCPVEIPLHHLILENRKVAAGKGWDGWIWSALFRLWARGLRSQISLPRNLVIAAAKIGGKLMRSTRKPVVPAAKSFATQWKDRYGA